MHATLKLFPTPERSLFQAAPPHLTEARAPNDGSDSLEHCSISDFTTTASAAVLETSPQRLQHPSTPAPHHPRFPQCGVRPFSHRSFPGLPVISELAGGVTSRSPPPSRLVKWLVHPQLLRATPPIHRGPLLLLRRAQPSHHSLLGSRIRPTLRLCRQSAFRQSPADLRPPHRCDALLAASPPLCGFQTPPHPP